ncbi:L-glutamate gamma-semialdehyde dehydrogenase [bacterium]|nr:L-glutamate gamma-semialdehyde dehydrogenase [FCB group bacterium]MBL7191579.1 L-glutamate gamma-semialdehyde dehydrogenase [bacterium]
MIEPFVNCPLTDFSDSHNSEAMRKAIEKVHAELGRSYPIVIGGEAIRDIPTFNSINPADPGQVIGKFAKGTKELALKAIETAYRKFEEWRWTPPEHRARYLLKAAHIMKQRRLELAAWMVFETSKSWMEADADLAEAIDFLEFYAREMIRYGSPQPVVPYPGEDNELVYLPLGVGVVIPPWNFPCAIMAGMTAASIVTGNTVVLKPASTAPAIAYKFFEIMREAGLPDGVLNFLPGPGGAIGDTIVTHPKTRFLAFTGSMEVGLRIHELAAKLAEGQIWIKRTILEMGGKDFIFVDEDADLNAAAEGITAASFGFQGQKCSACSRTIIHEKVYDKLADMLAQRAKAINIGPPDKQENYLGAVIDESAMNKILEYIEIGKGEGKLLAGGSRYGAKGYFIEPTILGDVKPDDRLSQEEIFGPVNALIKVKSFEEGIAVANGTIYGLTGAYFGGNRERIEIARQKLFCGNLYINRKCTGALVGVQPFGGFNMSGTDSKAGGRDYLGLFLQAKSITEKW